MNEFGKAGAYFVVAPDVAPATLSGVDQRHYGSVVGRLVRAVGCIVVPTVRPLALCTSESLHSLAQ